MSNNQTIGDADLSAYLDGQLDSVKRQEIEQALSNDLSAREKLEEYQRINRSLHAIYDPILTEDIPSRLIPKAKLSPMFRTIAASILLFLFGGVFGWQAQLQLTQSKPMEINLLQQAAFAHAVYTAETEHAVEVKAEQHEQLNRWLSQRLKTSLNAPDLNAMGYQLIGGRLLPSTQNRMAAQYMYENADGFRITLYVRRGDWKASQPIIHQQRNGYAMFYWSDKNLGYALTSDLTDAHQQNLAREAYRQINISADSA
tara:strand:- start:10697 stop:11467 length:771 start_codon:yes stop_codon:yes gene_type:complete